MVLLSLSLFVAVASSLLSVASSVFNRQLRSTGRHHKPRLSSLCVPLLCDTNRCAQPRPSCPSYPVRYPYCKKTLGCTPRDACDGRNKPLSSHKTSNTAVICKLRVDRNADSRPSLRPIFEILSSHSISDFFPRFWASWILSQATVTMKSHGACVCALSQGTHCGDRDAAPRRHHFRPRGRNCGFA